MHDLKEQKEACYTTLTMNKKMLVVGAVLIVVVVGGLSLLRSGGEIAAPANVSDMLGGEISDDAAIENGSPIAENRVITYTDDGYAPKTLEIMQGEMVTFVNGSSKEMWPASAMHPTHKAYPTTGGCIGSTFDACKAIAPGDSWSFTFDVTGAWGFHDHLTPTNF